MPTYTLFQAGEKFDPILESRIFFDTHSEKWLDHVKEAFAENFYEEVAQITATDMEDVFTVGNFMSRVKKPVIVPGKRMASVSVGDILFDGEEYWVVANFGFEKLK